MITLGEVLKTARISLHLSQRETCENICSQPMLSSIEKGKYIPNSQILILLCKKLKINMEQIQLNDNYPISSVNNFNNKVEELCNKHQYTELKKFLLNDKTIEKIDTSKQIQAYYYYLSIAYLQSDNDLDNFENNLRLSMAEQSNIRSTLDRLTLISMSVLYAKKHNDQSLDYVNKAFVDLENINFEPNQIILFYLAAYANILLEKNIDALNWINCGIDFATKNNSHYLLANLYYLLAKVLVKENKADLALNSNNRANIFKDLFNEQIFTFD